MHRIARLARDAVGVAPGERAAVIAICAVLVAVAAGLFGAAAFHALSEALGVQTARLLLGGAALRLAALGWAVGAIRAARRRRLAEAARARLALEVGAAGASGLRSAGVGVPVAAFVAAFLAGRRR